MEVLQLIDSIQQEHGTLSKQYDEVRTKIVVSSDAKRKVQAHTKILLKTKEEALREISTLQLEQSRMRKLLDKESKFLQHLQKAITDGQAKLTEYRHQLQQHRRQFCHTSRVAQKRITDALKRDDIACERLKQVVDRAAVQLQQVETLGVSLLQRRLAKAATK